MASVQTVANKVSDFLATKLDEGHFDENVSDIVMNELTGDEADNQDFVENFTYEVIQKVLQKLNRV